jgi:hypothetical protein
VSNPRIVMAVVQSDEGGAGDIRDLHSKRGGIFRSEDGGEKWMRTSDINPRPFYFSKIRIDPANDQRVYVLAMRFSLLKMAGAVSAKIIPRRFIRIATRSCFKPAPHSAQSAETGRQGQAGEGAGVAAAVVRHRRRRLPELLRREDLESHQQHSIGAILPPLGG